MKLTQVLCKQNLGRMARFIWQVQRNRPIQLTRAEQILASMGFSVQDALEVVKPPKPCSEFDLPPIPPNPDFKEEICLTYKDTNLLQEGESQACLLTKTVKVDDEIPEKVKALITDIPEHVDNLVKRITYTSSIFDPQQVKLPKLKDPNRPSWVFPRRYGITSTRKMHNLSRKFLLLCESLCDPRIAQNRSMVFDEVLSTCIEKESDLLQFSLKMDLIMTSLMPLSPIADANVDNGLDLPDIYPLHHTIGLTKSNIYKIEDEYPINMSSALMNSVHTIFINYDPETTKNLTELPTTQTQIYARSLIESFTAAAVYARKKFGANVKELPEPVVVQCVQSDGQHFHFSVYQLNTLNIDGMEGIRNFWWSAPTIKLYETAQYEDGIPCVEGYNNEVFKRFLAFYKNE
ncbi:39S ribosomal protein L37, mitochondrial [Hylaeus volcanicus]|uniref:39S ribosomal protein L37, mitochondrial n=1 Tax=Hylaeus volcanicus TaxID=313075 RepID=UPI0023B79690|nr:39S ribosomal protein L37, mitochondrial [Hylaeus volcanicus]XP_053984203.1 39S ribosomal protein L37, mitochondrial [Hylaeus volcanicus]